MKRRIVYTLITSFIFANSANADFAFTQPSDFTGEAFFTPPVAEEKAPSVKKDTSGTMPPIKRLRLRLKERAYQKELRNNALAPTGEEPYAGEVETSEYASKDLVDEFENEMISPDGFEADEEAVEEAKKTKRSFFKKKEEKLEPEDTENIVLDCDNVDYDTENYLITAKGGVNIEFVKQGIVVKADTITFDRMNNTIKAEGDVKIVKSGQVITGEYIFVDMNEENALIENPVTSATNFEIKARKGYVYGNRIVQEDGSITVDKSFPIEYAGTKRGPKLRRMIVPKSETLADDMEKGLIKVDVKDIKITQKGDVEIISLKKAKLFKGEKTLLKIPSMKIYTNKNHDFAETQGWEIGSYRGLGVYAGPGAVFTLPKGSVLKAMPILNYKSGFGIGGYGRFTSGTNKTMAAYGTAQSNFIVYGKQDLDDNLYLHYGVNSYMDEWFLGRRRPKYGVGLVYEKGYGAKDFLLKGQVSSYRHRIEGGYFQDLDFDTHFEKLKGTEMGTTRFRYMGDIRQNFYSYENKEQQKAFNVGMSSQLSTAIYGTGATQVIGRVGPTAHMQYRRWMQDIGYYFSVYDDNTPMPVFDAYRYGKQNLYVREYFRINRYLTLSWFGSMNLTGDSPNDKTFQENSFYVSVGPDDVKVSVGYDFVRENLYCVVELMTDAKGTKVNYETFEIKQEKKSKPDNNPKDPDLYRKNTNPVVLQKAVVEDVKVVEDVL